MKRLLIVPFLLACILFGSQVAHAQEKAKTEKHIIMFEGTLAEAQALAKKKKKIIFLDAYASWCGPCKMMKAQTFKNPEAADFYNDNFINMAIDMEKGEGPALAKKYGVRAYPTLLFINENGELVHTGLGFLPADKFITLGKEAMTKSGAKPTKAKKEKKPKKEKKKKEKKPKAEQTEN